MAELEDVTLDGKPLHSLRVADLKSALEQRGLPKSGQKNALIKRLKGALMLENLQRTSSPHMGLQPNSQIGEEMSQNSFIKQYLAKQQELLRQRLEREAREVAEADDSPADPDDDDHTKSSDITSCTAERAEEVMSAEACVLLPQSSDGSPAPAPRAPDPGPLEALVAPEAPIHGVASLSVRVLTGPPLALPAPPHSGPQLISSAQDDSDDDEDSDEEWGVGMGPGRSQPTWETLRCKQRPPWHVSPQLQQPTPPPSFPLPDTPKQSPPGLERPQGVAGGQGGGPTSQEQPGGVLGSPKTDAPITKATAPHTGDAGPPPHSGPAVTMETGEQETSAPKAGGSPQSPKELEEERESGVSPGHAHTLRDTPPFAPATSPCCLPLPPEESPLLSAPPRPDPGVLPPGGGTACVAMEMGVGGEWAGPGGVAPVLPPSPPPEEGDTARAKPCSSSDSSSSDSDSSSRPSASSSSRDEPHSGPVSWRGDLGSLGSRGPHGPPRKRRGEQEEQDGEVSHRKKPCPEDVDEDEMKRHQPMEVTQAGSGSVVEAEACSERRGPVEGSMGNSAESPTATTCSAPQISLPTVTKPASGCGPVAVGTLGPPAPPAGTLEEAESPVPASRKRRWDSSTTAAAKQQQPSGGFSSLKSLIPDAPPAADSSSQQEAVVELHPEEGRLSGDEEEEEQGTAGGLHVQRAVTQMASAGKQENGQKEGLEEEDEEDEAAGGGGDRQRPLKEERKDCSLVAMETQAPPTPEAPSKKAPPSGTRVRHSSQQRSGVSLTAEDPVCSAQKPPPPHGKGTNIIHICNLVRPFTLGQLKELLNETGTVVEEGFWIDKIKSHCYVTYPSVEEAVAARTALQGLKWPQTNPRFLRVDFCQQDELDHHRAQLDGVGAVQREGGGVGEWDQQAQRQRERERRERARGEREWDRDKVADFSRPGEDQRSPSHPPERTDQPRKENPPGKLLDDLFCKTKAPPCIYWLPLTEQQALQRKAERVERMKEREKRRKEQQQEEDRKREERRAGRSKEAGGVAEVGGASQPVTGERERESEKVRENEKVRDKENETEKVRGKEERGREEKDKERERGRGRESKEEERDKGRGREEKEKERGKVTGQGEKEWERERGREEKEGERERGREEKEGERERGREEKEGERERGREEKEGERERGREEKEGERERMRGKEEKEREKEGERERGRGREEKEREKEGERERGKGREEKEREKAGERARGREEKEREKEGERGRGREERERERGRGRGEREEERGKRRDGYSGRRADSKSRGGRRSRSHSNPPPPRDRRH